MPRIRAKQRLAEIHAKYALHLRQRDFVLSLVVGFLLLGASLVLNYIAGTYATEHASNSVTDLVLSNIPTFDVDGLFIYGTEIFWAFVIFWLLLEPKKIPFSIHSIALLVLVRSLFISLTHIGPFPTQIVINSHILAKFSFGGDLFFSSHTGLPFLMALIFWDELYLRVLFIGASLFFGVIVLLAHLHYSIDVLSAFFITYSIYRMAEIFFQKERQLFDS